MRSIVAIMLGLSLGWLLGPPVGEAFMDRVIARGAQTEGWTVRTDIGRYDGKWLLRSIVARVGLGALVPEEALYYRISVDVNGDPLMGGQEYRLVFAPGALPPAGAFWSLSPYHLESLTLVGNEINRFQIGDRTRGLRCARDGTLHFTLRPTMPPLGPSNWLPTPAEGQFDLVLRAYEPGPRMLSGNWAGPEITPVTRPSDQDGFDPDRLVEVTADDPWACEWGVYE